MKITAPDYYPFFRCTAGNCRHNCCIGWEIDIDEETLEFYKNVSGDFAVRLRKNIEDGECPHFILGEHERCPFLNRENLCDIYINLGEEHLCSICAEHPRFRNYIGGVCEVGLGLACEAAAELILTRESPVRQIEIGDDGEIGESSEWEDEILAMRERVEAIISDRSVPLRDRIGKLCGDVWFSRSPEEWGDFFGGLEILDSAWNEALGMLNRENARWTEGQIPEYMYENLLRYFIYRHTPDAADEWNFDARVCFAILSYAVIRTVCEGLLKQNGSLSTADLMETARMYSSEIEYSEENTEAVIEETEALM